MSGVIEVFVTSKQASSMIERLWTRLGPEMMTLFLEENVEPYIQRRAQNRFDTEGDSAVGKWKKLADSTIERRQSDGYVPIRINHRTGELEDYITKSDGRIVEDGGEAVLTYPGRDGLSAELSTKVNAAQFGDVGSNTPARPVLALDLIDLQYVETSLELFILAGITR